MRRGVTVNAAWTGGTLATVIGAAVGIPAPGQIDLAIPKLREGSYFPDWLLERRRRAESALISVVATSYLLGVSTRRMEKLVEQLQLAIGLGCGRPCKWFWGRIGCGEISSCRTASPQWPNFPADVEHNLAHDRIAANHRDVVSP